MNDDRADLIGLIENPPVRRMWLLANALRSLPLDRAIELARSAEAFVTGSSGVEHVSDRRSDVEASEVPDASEQLAEATTLDASVEQPTPTKRARLILPTEHRERLLERLARGVKNAELATEFGVSSKQVQGLRMGCAREIAQRRDQLGEKPVHPDQTLAQSASVEDIVRYLRQQDDVVVLQQDGSYLINGRFRMPVAELTVRANRMRSRQGQPVFQLPGGTPAQSDKISSANGHPLFWKDGSARSERVRNGSEKPATIETC